MTIDNDNRNKNKAYYGMLIQTMSKEIGVGFFARTKNNNEITEISERDRHADRNEKKSR